MVVSQSLLDANVVERASVLSKVHTQITTISFLSHSVQRSPFRETVMMHDLEQCVITDFAIIFRASIRDSNIRFGRIDDWKILFQLSWHMI